MGMPARAAQRSYRVTLGANPANPASWLMNLFGGDRTASGIRVTGDAAMHYVAVFSSCRNLAQDVGTLPAPVIETASDGRKRRLREDPVDRIFNREANDEGMPSSALRGALQGHAALRGNGFAEIEFDKALRPRGLWPLRADKMRLVRNGQNAEIDGARDGQLAYAYTLPSGEEKLFAPEKIYHVRGFGDGQWGHSVVSLASESIGAALAAEEFGARFWANDARPGIVLTRPKEVAALTPEARTRLKGEWEEAHRPLDKKWRIGILQEGMDLKEVGIPPEDAQFLQTLKHQSSDVTANWFRMPPPLLMDYSRLTYTNAEQVDIIYVKYSLRFWFVTTEQEASIKLLGPGRTLEHNAEGLYRGDAKSRGEFYQARMASSSITPNRIADLENEPRSMDPVADQFLIPLASIPSGALDENGMTLRDRVNMAGVLTRAGFDPVDTLAKLNLPDIKHTGLVPVTVQIDPDKIGAST